MELSAGSKCCTVESVSEEVTLCDDLEHGSESTSRFSAEEVERARMCEVLGSSLPEGESYMGVRRQAREVAVQAIYMMDFNDNWDIESQLEVFFSTFESLEQVREFARELVQGVAEHKDRLDSLISKASENWSISRMARVDRAILRLATFELCCLSEIPSTVSINEAIEVAKRFGSDDSPTFVNGVVDKIAHFVTLAEEPNETDIDPKSTEADSKKAAYGS